MGFDGKSTTPKSVGGGIFYLREYVHWWRSKFTAQTSGYYFFINSFESQFCAYDFWTKVTPPIIRPVILLTAYLIIDVRKGKGKSLCNWAAINAQKILWFNMHLCQLGWLIKKSRAHHHLTTRNHGFLATELESNCQRAAVQLKLIHK